MQDALAFQCGNPFSRISQILGKYRLVMLSQGRVPPSVESFLQRIGRGNRRSNESSVVCLVPPESKRPTIDALAYHAIIKRAESGSFESEPAFTLFGAAVQQILSHLRYEKGGYVRTADFAEPILDRELWDATQLLLRSHTVRRASRATKSAPSPLTGRLFDESGQGLTPSHAVKGERRYRYYVSRNLSKKTPDSGRAGWRLPAPEIERTVAAAAYTMLGDEAAIANAALAIGLAEHQLPSLFSLAAAWTKRLQSDVEVGAALNAMVDRVDLIDTGIRVSLKLPNSITEQQHGATSTELTITRVFPMQIRRRGFEMRRLSKVVAPLPHEPILHF